VVSKLDSGLEGCGFEYHPILNGNAVSKPCQDQFLHPILVHLIEKKENKSSQMGHTKKFTMNKYWWIGERKFSTFSIVPFDAEGHLG